MTERNRRAAALRAAVNLAGVLALLWQMQLAAQSSSPPAVKSTETSPANGKLREFEVASIKENKSVNYNTQWRTTPDGLTINNFTLKNLIAGTYGIKEDLISGGPGWVNTTSFDINAKVAGEYVPTMEQLTGKQRTAMIKPLLADRFHLQVHIVTKILPVYDLVVAKTGPKLTTSTAPVFKPGMPRTPGAKFAGTIEMGGGYLTGIGLTMPSLVSRLSYVVHRTVIDRTELTGAYDFTLKYASPEQRDSGKPDNGETDQVPSIFTALEEQLGLKLQPTKGPVDTLVIDHVEKPIEN